MEPNKNLFLRTNELWSEMSKSINTYEEMIIISPFIDGKQINELKKVIDQWDYRKNFQLKILTTTFDGQMRFLDLKSLKKFILLIKEKHPNIEISLKIEDARQHKVDRLHAKAYLFRNQKTSEVIYNGSSNFTFKGINTGEEWNLKITRNSEPNICKEIDDNFNFLWTNKKCFSLNKDSRMLDTLMNYKNSIENMQKKSIDTKEAENIISLVNSYPYPAIELNKNFIPENNTSIKDKLFWQFSILNNEYLINRFIRIIESKKLTEDDAVNNLFIASFIAGELNLRSPKKMNSFLTANNYKEPKEIVFDVKYRDTLNEIKKVLEENKLKLKNYLVKNKNLKHTFLTYQQCKALSYHADYRNYEHWNLCRTSGVEVSQTKNSKIALFTYDKNSNTKRKYDYRDEYEPDGKKDTFLWFCPNTWKINRRYKVNEWIVNKVKETQIFLKLSLNKDQDQTFYEYVGKVKRVNSEKWLKEDQKIIYFDLSD